MKLSFLLSACIFFAACSRSGVETNSAGIVGKWQQIASQDITGRWVESETPLYVEFSADGKMMTVNGEYQSIADYELTADGKIKFGVPLDVTREYTIKGNVLTLGGPCFEPCFATYKRL